MSDYNRHGMKVSAPEPCSWCDKGATIKLGEVWKGEYVGLADQHIDSYNDYACEPHAIEWSDTYDYSERIST